MVRIRKLGGAMAVLSVAWLASGVLAAYALTRRAHPREAEQPDPGEPRYQMLRLTSSDGVSIGAWLAERDTDRVAVVLAHGHGASRTELQAEARALHRAGATVMPISLRAHGDSDGDRDDLGWSARHDVEAAVASLRAARPERPIVVLGYSAGAAAALYAAESLHDRVAGYVLVAPYADIADATRYRTRRYLPPVIELVAYGALRFGALFLLPDLDRMRPIDRAGALRGTPSLFVAGGTDDRAPERDIRAMADRAEGALRVVPNMQHEDLHTLVDDPAWSEVTSFVMQRGN